MSTQNDYHWCLEKVAAAPPKRKAALVRSLLPEIEMLRGICGFHAVSWCLYISPAKRSAHPDTKTPESLAHADEVCL